jgi:hypothetical protein
MSDRPIHHDRNNSTQGLLLVLTVPKARANCESWCRLEEGTWELAYPALPSLVSPLTIIPSISRPVKTSAFPRGTLRSTRRRWTLMTMVVGKPMPEEKGALDEIVSLMRQQVQARRGASTDEQAENYERRAKRIDQLINHLLRKKVALSYRLRNQSSSYSTPRICS